MNDPFSALFAGLIPFVIFAEIPAQDETWFLSLSNYGVAGIMLLFFIWWTKRTEDRRDAERVKTNELQEENTKALNLMTRGLMVQVMAMRHVDETARELAAKIKEEADAALLVPNR